MDLLARNAPLAAIRGKTRATVVDHRAPLLSPVTVLVLLLREIGFRWYGGQHRLPDGSTGTTCFLDTSARYDDGSEIRRVAWSFCAGESMELGGDPVTIAQVCHAFDASHILPGRPILPGAARVLKAIRAADPDAWRGEMLFNERGKRLLHAAAMCGNREAQLLLAEVVELYRGFAWKLSTPVEAGPHPLYGYPLERHLRYHKGKRTGDVRSSICRDERMEELRMFGLR